MDFLINKAPMADYFLSFLFFWFQFGLLLSNGTQQATRTQIETKRMVQEHQDEFMGYCQVNKDCEFCCQNGRCVDEENCHDYTGWIAFAIVLPCLFLACCLVICLIVNMNHKKKEERSQDQINRHMELIFAQRSLEMLDPAVVTYGQVIEGPEEAPEGKKEEEEIRPLEIQDACLENDSGTFLPNDSILNDLQNNSTHGLLPNEVDGFFTPNQENSKRPSKT